MQDITVCYYVNIDRCEPRNWQHLTGSWFVTYFSDYVLLFMPDEGRTAETCCTEVNK